MKLAVECLSLFSDQDRIDLAKIWPHQNLDLLEQSLDLHQRLFASRFNGRLLAAVMVEIDGEYAELDDLMVREATRRRGVGLHLIQEVVRQLPGVKEFWLTAADHAGVNEVVLDRFMESCGFFPVSGGWLYTRS